MRACEHRTMMRMCMDMAATAMPMMRPARKPSAPCDSLFAA